MDEDEQLERFDSEFASTSSISSTLSTDDFRNLTSSGDISSISSGSGEIPPVAVLAPPFLYREGSNDVETAPAPREKCVGRSNKGVSWGHTSVIGRRKEMEDAIAVIPGFMSRTCDRVGGCTAPGSRSSGEIAPLHFFGVYDGHGGSQVAKFCAKRMHDVIAEEWDREIGGAAEWQRRWEAVFANSFERTDNEILSDAVAPEMDTNYPLDSGSEGDRYLRPWIIPVPEITFTARTDEDECLVLASDGLWDVMTNEEVGEVARRILRRRRRSLSMEETSPAQVVAESLTEIAYGRNSKDNISIIVVDLKSKRKRQQRPPLIS
uniref:protein-serine/threonine phosphatase n=1 Tax=Glycine max TaxID=3847 RepID=A0A0R0ILV3_SOYBN